MLAYLFVISAPYVIPAKEAVSEVVPPFVREG